MKHPPALTDELLATGSAVDAVLGLLRARTGRDFSQYKRRMVLRRLERRMHVCEVDGIAAYARYIEAHPKELDVLFDELLIGVSSFFRDQDAFEALGEQLAQLVAQKADGESIRVWVPACSTGEEAYSIAILLHECMAKANRRLDVRIIASDLSPIAINVARSAVYPAEIADDLGEERLARFFIREKDSYRIIPHIRKLVVFARHDITTDPPFGRLDLLSCRNVLIYFEPLLQQRLPPLFHHALGRDGILFLGSSESSDVELFAPIDKRWRIYRRRAPGDQRSPSLPMLPLAKYGARRMDSHALAEDVAFTREEFQWTKEELQAMNEELAACTDEMQSLNEELETVNDELRAKVEELTRANDDLHNLEGSVMAVSLDSKLRVRRRTEATSRIVRLLSIAPGDPVEELASCLGSAALALEARHVLQTLNCNEMEVHTPEGASYLVRLQPYRTIENTIDGVLIIFFESSRVSMRPMSRTFTRGENHERRDAPPDGGSTTEGVDDAARKVRAAETVPGS